MPFVEHARELRIFCSLSLAPPGCWTAAGDDRACWVFHYTELVWPRRGLSPPGAEPVVPRLTVHSVYLSRPGLLCYIHTRVFGCWAMFLIIFRNPDVYSAGNTEQAGGWYPWIHLSIWWLLLFLWTQVKQTSMISYAINIFIDTLSALLQGGKKSRMEWGKII